MENEVTPQKERLESGSRIELRSWTERQYRKELKASNAMMVKALSVSTNANLEMANTQHKLGERAPRFPGHCTRDSTKMFPDNISYSFRNTTSFNSAKHDIGFPIYK